VLGHEVAHAANGDMVTLALIQGVVNTFVMFLSRVIGHLVDKVVFKTGARPGPGLLRHHDRRRAGAGHPRIDHRHVVLAPARVPRPTAARQPRRASNMIAALERLNALHPQPLPDRMAAFGIAAAGAAASSACS